MAWPSPPFWAAALVATALAVASSGPARAETDALDGRWVPEGDGASCDDPYFRIDGATLTFTGGEPWAIDSDGLILTVEPPATCLDCERAPFDIMPDGSLQRFVEGTVERFVNCDALRFDAAGALRAERTPDQEPATERWQRRDGEDGSEAYFSTGRTTLVVGCRPGPATVYLRYYPERDFRFPDVRTPRGPANVLIGTVHPQFGAYASAYDFTAGFAGARVFYEGTWSAGDEFFVREQAFRLIAGLTTGTEAFVQSPTVVADTDQRQYEDRIGLGGSTEAIADAMQAGGCAAFLAATEQAIRSGNWQ